MAKEAEAHAEEDKAKRESIDARNGLDSAVYQAEKLKADNAEKISDEDKKTLEEAVEAAKKVVADKKADKDALEAAAKELSDKTMPIGAKLYEEAAKEEAPAEDGDKKEEPVEGEVVDEDKKEDKKA
jgi:molecular chaperone DnaK